MVLRLDQNTSIEDLRHHPAEVIEKLRDLLASGAVAHEDPQRESFYEVESNGRVYYICVSPITGKVLLLGTWLADRKPAASSKAA
jgi:hypothetical protein